MLTYDDVTRVDMADPKAWGTWRWLVAHGCMCCDIEPSGGAWEHVELQIELILVGFFSGLSNLSIYAFSLAIWWTKGLDLRVAKAVKFGRDLVAVSHF